MAASRPAPGTPHRASRTPSLWPGYAPRAAHGSRSRPCSGSATGSTRGWRTAGANGWPPIWPAARGYAPSLVVLDRLAQLCECSIGDLLADVGDHRALDAHQRATAHRNGVADGAVRELVELVQTAVGRALVACLASGPSVVAGGHQR